MLNFPEAWDIGWEVIKAIDWLVDWVIINCDPFFAAINVVISRGILGPFEDFLQWIPWWIFIAVVGLIAWRAVSVKFGITAIVFLVIMGFLGLYDLAMSTLAIVLTASLLCIVVGIPLGISASKSSRFERILRPILDGMQTMPSFVYLIPALMLFGLGRTPAVIATTIYAIPPIIRLTTLGINGVDSQVVEAGKSFGATPWQMLAKVQIPLAMPTILAGLNQTIMMALAMVVIASMIGAKTLGTEVLNGIARIEVGRGFIGGLGIVFTAIILDRISQGFAKKPKTIRTAT
ncbi:ABC transporter permease [Chloroflexota bacterium]